MTTATYTQAYQGIAAQPCLAHQALATLDQIDRADVDAHLSDSAIPTQRMHEALSAIGCWIPMPALQAHRDGDCGCTLPTTDVGGMPVEVNRVTAMTVPAIQSGESKYKSLDELAVDYLAALETSVTDRAALWARLTALEQAAVTFISVGELKLPLVALGATTSSTVTLKLAMPSAAYKVRLLPGVGLVGAASHEITAQTATTVTVRTTAALLIAAGAVLHVVAYT